jgi:hypothetical protein
VGKVVQPLQSVNYHDSHAHGHEGHGPFTRLVGFGWLGSIGLESSWFGSWHVGGAKPVCMVPGLATGGMPVSFGWFLAIGVTPVSLWPLITLGNLGASSCLDVI